MKRQPIPAYVRRALFRLQRSTCQHCGQTTQTQRIEIDHVIPVALGGTNAFENLQLLCRPCNRRKGSRLVDRRQGVISRALR